MPPRTSQASKSQKEHRQNYNASSLPAKKLKPLTTISKPPVFGIDGCSSQGGDDVMKIRSIKAKGKAKASTPDTLDIQDDRLWVDIYEPTSEAQLAVHKKKVEDVRRWFLEAFDGGPSGKLKKYRRILALTGPAGTAKTTTVRVLAKELKFEILEWQNAIGGRVSRDEESLYDDRVPMDREDLFQKFQAFLTRASTCQSIFSTSDATSRTSHSSLHTPPSTHCPSQDQSTTVRVTIPPSRKHIILLEDLPNILHSKTQDSFHSSLQALVDSPNPSIAPIVIIVSDSGVRGEASDEKLAQGGGWGKDVVDIRSVLSPALLASPYVTQIGFNPIAPTLLRRALQSLLASRALSQPSIHSPSKEFLDLVVESANGDIRSAVMALQFACVVRLPADRQGKSKATKGAGSGSAKVILEAITRREQSLALFHLMGKVLYNKRKGDPSSQSATAKDLIRERELDGRLKEPPKLPTFHRDHERRASRVDIDALYADSPIDSSLFSLYIHQNYTQFCNEMEQCDGVAEWLSWVDSSGGEAWYQANPHRFHLLTLGTLHSLPSPVVRRSQKVFKPEFFDMLNREKDGWGGVGDVRKWLIDEIGMAAEMDKPGVSMWRAGGWSRSEIALELGGVLKARDATGIQPGPASHKKFSRLIFVRDGNAAHPLGEGDTVENMGDIEENEPTGYRDSEKAEKEKTDGGWLENDDIEEF